MSTAATATAPSAWKRATRSSGLAVGLVLAVTMVVIAIAAPWIAPFDPNDQDVLLKLEPPRPRTGSAPTPSAATCSRA